MGFNAKDVSGLRVEAFRCSVGLGGFDRGY